MLGFYFQEEGGYSVDEGCEMSAVSRCSAGMFFLTIIHFHHTPAVSKELTTFFPSFRFPG